MTNIVLTIANDEVAPALQKAHDMPSATDVTNTVNKLPTNSKIIVGSNLTNDADKKEYSTLQDGLQASVAGDVIQVRAGAYTGVISLKEGVTVICESNAYFYNSNVTGASIPNIKWLGEAVLVITDNTGQAVYLDSCVNYRFEVNSIQNWGDVTNADRPGFFALSSSGYLTVKSESFTYNNELISVNNNWDATPRKTTVTTAELRSYRVAANVGSLKVQCIGASNAADLDWYVTGSQISDNNNCAFVGAATTPPASSPATKMNMLSSGAVFDGDNASFLAVGHANTETILEMSGVSRHKSSKFAHSTGSGKVNTTLKIFAPTVALSGDTDSVFTNAAFGTITVTPEAA